MAIQAFNTHLDIDHRPILDPGLYKHYHEHSFYSLFDRIFWLNDENRYIAESMLYTDPFP